ncbi:MAG: serine/threonine-protein kinase [Polyangiales bacterium]
MRFRGARGGRVASWAGKETLQVVEPARTPQPGELIAGKYAIEEQLGSGGMGTVYAARHASTGRRFAIKLLKPQLAGDAEAEARFMREATLASAINHPAIVEVYDVGRHADAPYMVMKLLHGESLGQRLERGAMGPEEAIAVILPVLDGVAAAHDRGIIHRDLKPDNILLQREGERVQPKVLDFGISKLLGPDAHTRLTRNGMSLGTPLYMSPEQVRGDADVDHRADVYALGVILYEMLAGVLPYDGNNYADLVLKIIQGGAPRVRERNANVSPALDAVVMRAFAVSREDRHANARLLAKELQALEGLAPARIDARISRAPATPAGTPFAVDAARSGLATRAPRKPARYALLALAVVAVISSLLWLARSSKQGARPELRAGSVANSTDTRAATAPAPALPEPVRPAPSPVVRVVEPQPPRRVEAQPHPPPIVPSRPRAGAVLTIRPVPEPREAVARPAPPPARPAPEPRHRTRMPSEIIDPFEK